MPPRRPFEQRRGHQQGSRLQPGDVGFLFTIQPQSDIRATREIEALLSDYLEREIPTSTAAAAAGVAQPKDQAANDDGASVGGGISFAASLAAELGEYRRPVPAADASGGSAAADGGRLTGKKRPRADGKAGGHPWLRALDVRVKGYLFYVVRDPAKTAAREEAKRTKAATSAARAAAAAASSSAAMNADGEGVVPAATANGAEPKQSATEDATKSMEVAEQENDEEDGVDDEEDGEEGKDDAATAGESQRAFLKFTEGPSAESLIVWRVAEKLLSDLATNPRPVVRFTFRLMPIIASGFPTAACLSHLGAFVVTRHRAALRGIKDDEDAGEPSLLPSSRATLAVRVFERNNTNAGKLIPDFVAAIVAQFPPSVEMVCNEAVRRGSPVDAMLCVAIMQSVACVALMPRYVEYLEYNIHKLGARGFALAETTSGSLVKSRIEPPPTTAAAEVPLSEDGAPNEQ